ncbi:MAG: hypothetical protein PHY08_04790 [Candidatus Cloacimonetes bacterium]|jgi:hypothetical protein|nr:hypothetical protein [Candidatus Cloacimonadota bacterium]
MKKIVLALLLCMTTALFADFIIPFDDPIYEFLEMTNTLKMSSLNHFQYPLYHSEVMDALKEISNLRNRGFYKKQAIYHYERLNMNYPDGTQFAVVPPKKTIDSIGNLFKPHSNQFRLVTITDPDTETKSFFNLFTLDSDDTNLFISGMLGYQYDIKKDDNNDNRTRKYYGIESGGNFADNFGYYLRFRKGHYTGDEDFIVENPFISTMGDSEYSDDGKFYQVDLISELDFKNEYLNLSVGYGSFEIGRSITSSIILNNEVTPYGYFKMNKRFGILEYNGITTQLTPDELKNDSDYQPKSMATQTISLHTSNISFGLGNTIIYGDRTIDLAYSSPLAIYKIMDNKYHGRDNGLFFGFGEIRPLSGVLLYGNFLFDDIRNDRLKTSKWMSYLALQGGVIYQDSNIPLEVATEVTAVGPSTYQHKSKSLTYMHDDMLLGAQYGSNYLSFANRLRMSFSQFSFSFLYENIQQGSIGIHPSSGGGERKFLDEYITRYQYLTSQLNLRLIPELFIFVKHQYNILEDNELQYFYTGAEFKY